MAQPLGPKSKSKTIDLSQTGAPNGKPEPIEIEDVLSETSNQAKQEAELKARLGGPHGYPDWVLGHLVPFDIDDRLITIFNCAAALCQHKTDAQTVLSSSTLVFGVIETALRFPVNDEADPASRILDLLRAHELTDAQGGSDHRPFGQLRNRFFRSDFPDTLSVTKAEADRLSLSDCLETVLQNIARLGGEPISARTLLSEVFNFAAAPEKASRDHARLLDEDRFAFGEALSSTDYIAALHRHRTPDPTVVNHEFFKTAQSEAILGIAASKNLLGQLSSGANQVTLRDRHAADLVPLDENVEKITVILTKPNPNSSKYENLIGWARATVTDAENDEITLEVKDRFAEVSLSAFALDFDPMINHPTAFVARAGTVNHEIFRRLVTGASFVEHSTSDPRTELASDRPEVLVDKLGRAELALALANAVNEICEGQIKQHLRTDPKEFWNRWTKQNTESAAFTLHIDAPWGGGKTTFANFLAAVLNPEIHDPKFFAGDRELYDIERNFGEDSVLARLFTPLRTAYVKETESGWKWRDAKWIPVWFNAWEHQHVQPPWWDIRQSIRREYRRHLGYWDWLKEGAAELVWRFFTPNVRWTLFFSLVFFGLGWLAYNYIEPLRDGLNAFFHLGSADNHFDAMRAATRFQLAT